MERQSKGLYESMANITGKNLTDVEAQMDHARRNKREEMPLAFVVLSESFPSFNFIGDIAKAQVR